EEGEGDLAAAGLTRTPTRTEAYLAGPVYQNVRQQVVCRRGAPIPKTPGDLPGISLTVVAGSSYVERLEALRPENPGLSWSESEAEGTEELLEAVWEGNIPCTVADSNIVAINRRYFPELLVAFDLTEPEPLVWYFPREAKDLKAAVEDWFDEYQDDGKLDLLLDKYYGFIEIFDYVDTRSFVRAIDEVLPHYQALFRKTGREYHIPWALLAAQAYQESHWRPRAKSPTGVKGLMMLTLPTAKEVGVSNRLDPEQSVRGGAKYLDNIRRRLPEEMAEPDRTWIALAAYNVGMGHVRDARELARRLKKDPDQWSSLSEVLPLLSQKKYYKTLKHGYARGREPVLYVNRIRNYRDILEKTLEGEGG
ncbi:MAG TPA: membrane-bound lytic murein transglycosylase MltF, partial [Nitrospiria bacterium]|nr:membrane-bound lytic murein transglycosylase MltF [Nitrospiria bacterium]